MLTLGLLWTFGRCTTPNLTAHPDAADVGDALFINTEWSMVEEIALQYTMVQRYDGVRIWWPNHVLCNGAVMNISRSSFRWESYKVGTQWARWSGGIAALHAGLSICGCRVPGHRHAAHSKWAPGMAGRGTAAVAAQLEQSHSLKPAVSSLHMKRQQTCSSHHLLWQRDCP